MFIKKIVLGLGLASGLISVALAAFPTAAHAYCDNRSGTYANVQQVAGGGPNGSMWVVLSVSDHDYENYRRIWIYDQNNVLVVNQAWNQWSGYVPKGKDYRFHAPNLNTCGAIIPGAPTYTQFHVDNR